MLNTIKWVSSRLNIIESFVERFNFMRTPYQLWSKIDSEDSRLARVGDSGLARLARVQTS